MATIREVKKKGKIISYCFTVSLGRDKQGKQIRKNLTWKPTEGMTPAKARKAAERAAAAEWELEVRGNNQQRIEEKNQVQTVQNILLERKDDFVSFVNDTWFSLFICNGDRKETTIDAWVFVFWSKSVSAKRGTNIFNIVVFQLLAVGFKVNNERAVQFRKWANTIVKDYTIKGWVMDDERLKNGGSIRRLPISTPQPWTTTRRRRQPRGGCEGAAQNVLCRPWPHRRRRPRYPDRRREHHR